MLGERGINWLRFEGFEMFSFILYENFAPYHRVSLESLCLVLPLLLEEFKECRIYTLSLRVSAVREVAACEFNANSTFYDTRLAALNYQVH